MHHPQPRKEGSTNPTHLLGVVVDDGLGVLVEGLEAVPQRRRLVVRAVDQRLARQLFCVGMWSLVREPNRGGGLKHQLPTGAECSPQGGRGTKKKQQNEIKNQDARTSSLPSALGGLK